MSDAMTEHNRREKESREEQFKKTKIIAEDVKSILNSISTTNEQSLSIAYYIQHRESQCELQDQIK